MGAGDRERVYRKLLVPMQAHILVRAGTHSGMATRGRLQIKHKFRFQVCTPATIAAVAAGYKQTASLR